MNWYKVTKHYRGGSSEFQVAVPEDVKLSKGEWETILEWLGENTDGGHAYGYSLKTRKLKRKSDLLPHVKYPTGLCHSLVGRGEWAIERRRML